MSGGLAAGFVSRPEARTTRAFDRRPANTARAGFQVTVPPTLLQLPSISVSCIHVMSNLTYTCRSNSCVVPSGPRETHDSTRTLDLAGTNSEPQQKSLVSKKLSNHDTLFCVKDLFVSARCQLLFSATRDASAPEPILKIGRFVCCREVTDLNCARCVVQKRSG